MRSEQSEGVRQQEAEVWACIADTCETDEELRQYRLRSSDGGSFMPMFIEKPVGIGGKLFFCTLPIRVSFLSDSPLSDVL